MAQRGMHPWDTKVDRRLKGLHRGETARIMGFIWRNIAYVGSTASSRLDDVPLFWGTGGESAGHKFLGIGLDFFNDAQPTQHRRQRSQRRQRSPRCQRSARRNAATQPTQPTQPTPHTQHADHPTAATAATGTAGRATAAPSRERPQGGRGGRGGPRRLAATRTSAPPKDCARALRTPRVACSHKEPQSPPPRARPLVRRRGEDATKNTPGPPFPPFPPRREPGEEKESTEVERARASRAGTPRNFIESRAGRSAGIFLSSGRASKPGAKGRGGLGNPRGHLRSHR